MTVNTTDWPYVYGKPSGQGLIKQHPKDFIVEEIASFEPSGTGEHQFIWLEKEGQNTEFVAKQLARFANVKPRDIGYAGLKDRHALTRQWFSVWLPGALNQPDWTQCNIPGVRFVQITRHARKLKTGVLSGNRFQLTIRDWQGDKAETEVRLLAIKQHGMANYFGEQRFGHEGQNISKALLMFNGAKTSKTDRSLYLSAVRAFLFNQVLARRVLEQNWNQPLPGDCLGFADSHSWFRIEQPDATIQQRVANHEVHPTGLLFGKSSHVYSGVAPELEADVLAHYPELTQGLIDCGLEADRRVLRVSLADLTWQIEPNVLHLCFSLPPGSYATALLRELIATPRA
ncbi:tRNA pseudouridine(13) synthase TruD [Methylocucumis oryzae]|uniref:tRNA pseudouridine synthase D n=1 Tax=Methylocucumis oryzae TaxID=1632867 RepID=A0A0F3IGU9_9GAMM|nr:tRNA pseudouridine(13) synthase TruD [Methylocucumis oryzae]KJV05763.1 pseudouridine synthase [Methylocucumis oryzae]